MPAPRRLKNNLDGYFEGAVSNSTALWVTHPFEAKLESIADDDPRNDELIDINAQRHFTPNLFCAMVTFPSFGVD